MIHGCKKESIELLIDKGADVNSKTNELFTPLHFAMIHGCKKEIIELLIDKGADVNSKDNELFTPLSSAILNNCEKEIIELLINKGADVSLKGFRSSTALHHAIFKKRSLEIIDLIHSNGANQISFFPEVFYQFELGKDDKIIKHILKKPETFHIDLRLAILANFSCENINLLLKKDVNINISGLSELITQSKNYEQLKEIESFKNAKSFLIKNDLSKEENHLYYLLHDKHIEKMHALDKGIILEIFQHEKCKDIEYIKEKYDIDITTKTKNREGINFLKAYYCLVNDCFIPKINEDLMIPKKLSPEYAKIIKKCNKVTERCNVYKGIPSQIAEETLKIANQKDSEEEHRNIEENIKTEEGNTIIHVQGAFKKGEDIQMNETFVDEYINKNGWTPLFTSVFYNNSSARHYFESHALNKDRVDYFGNDATFYESRTHKQ